MNHVGFMVSNMNFMRFKWLYFFISLTVILPGVYSLIKWGFRPSIDFTGGTIVEIKNEKFNPPAGGQNDNLKFKIEESVNRVEGMSLISAQLSGEDKYILRLKPVDKEQIKKIKEALSREFGEIEVVRLETVGPILGKELLIKTLAAVVLASAAILTYVAYRFKNKMFGVCAILAMFHDTLVLLGIFSLLGHFYGVEVDTLFVTAVLTILSFSVHDTIVVYDRIRESQKKTMGVSFEGMVNKAVTETLSRSINNSLTIIFMLLALWLMGGATIKWFIFALLIGTISGTYSSTFTAAPLLVVWEEISLSRRKR